MTISFNDRVAPRTVLALCAAVFVLAGCAARPAGAPALGSNTDSSVNYHSDGKDRVTASDEPEAAKRARVRLELATAYYGRGQLTTALDEVKQSIAADPNVSAAFNLRGLIYGGLGDQRLAEDSFRQALQIDPRDADSMQNFGWHLCQQSRFGEAESLFTQALNVPRYQDSARTMLTQGICQARSGKLPAAERTLSKAYALDPGSPAIAVNLAEVLLRAGDFERARFYVRRANSNVDVVNAQTLWLAARIENRLGNAQGVEEFGKQLRNRFPQSPEATSLAEGRFNE
jgi:type IV pilus assembly protein PilF